MEILKKSKNGCKYCYGNIKYLDNIKTKYCEDNNIKLIRIPYWNYNNIEQILELELK